MRKRKRKCVITFVESVAFLVDANFAGFLGDIDAPSRFFRALFFVHRSASYADLEIQVITQKEKYFFYLDFLHSLLLVIFRHLLFGSRRETVLLR